MNVKLRELIAKGMRHLPSDERLRGRGPCQRAEASVREERVHQP
jgi:hypothetical protein